MSSHAWLISSGIEVGYVLDHPAVHNGKTWVSPDQCGTNTEPTLSALAGAFPEAKVTVQQANRHSSADQDHDLRLGYISRSCRSQRSKVHMRGTVRQGAQRPNGTTDADGRWRVSHLQVGMAGALDPPRIGLSTRESHRLTLSRFSKRVGHRATARLAVILSLGRWARYLRVVRPD